jgi:hypothetical protein
MRQFEKNEWNHLHDVVLSATWDTSKLKLSQSELEDLFEELPEHIKEDAYHWGLNDTVVRDSIYVWIKKNNISDVMFSEERTEVKCCIGGYIIEKDQFGATGRILRCKKHLT